MIAKSQGQRTALRKQLLSMGFVCETLTYNDHRETWVCDGAVLTIQWTYPLPEDATGPQKPSGAPMRYFLIENSCMSEISKSAAKSMENNGFAHVIQGGSGVVPEHCRQPGETEEQYLAPWLVMTLGPAPAVERV